MGKVVDTQAEVAKALRVTNARVSQWKKRGMPRTEDGKWDIDEIVAWKKRTFKLKGPGNRILGPVSEEEKAAWALRKNTGMGIKKIANATNLSVDRVRKVIGDMEDNKANIERFKEAKADIFAFEQIQYLGHITDEKLEETNAKDLAMMAKMAYDKERIETGESTENVAVIVKHIREIKERRKQIDAGTGQEAD